MPRKTTGKRISLLESAWGSILHPDKFNPTTKKMSTEISVFINKKIEYRFPIPTLLKPSSLSLYKTFQSAPLLYFFNEGTDFIFDSLFKTRTAYLNANKLTKPPNELSDDNIAQTVVDLCYVFSTQQPWYLTYLYKKPLSINVTKDDLSYFNQVETHVDKNNITIQKPFFSISTTQHRKLTQTFYSPAVIVSQTLEKSFSTKELEMIRKNDPSFKYYEKLDMKLQTELRVFLGLNTNQIEPPFNATVLQHGLKLLIKNYEYTVPISNLTTVGMSTIFKTLPFKKKILQFLSKNNASVSVIELYNQLEQNPTLFFDLKQQALLDKKLLISLNTFIDLFNQSFILPENHKALSPEEQTLVQSQNAFLYTPKTIPQVHSIRLKIYKSLTFLSNFLFPVDTTNQTNLTVLQIQNILFMGFLKFKTRQVWFAYIQKEKIGCSPKTFLTFLNTFINYDSYIAHVNTVNPADYRKKYPYVDPLTLMYSKAKIQHQLSFALLLSILTKKRIDFTQSLAHSINTALEDMTNVLPIFHVSL